MSLNLNILSWKEFQLNELFKLRGGYFNKKPEHSDIGDIPFLASTESNNGVTEYYSLDDIESWDKVGDPDNTLDKKIFDGNCIAVTVNGSVCNAFYQNKNFTCSHDITVLYLKNHDLNQQIAEFLCTIIMLDKYRWSYGRKPHDVKKFGKSIIKLPIDENGEPDREFMENYIKNLRYKPITTKNKSGNFKLNIDEWAEFKVGDILECSTTILSIKDELDIGKTPLISRTAMNNGCDGYFDIEENKITKKGCITIGAEGIYAFYQPEDFGTGNKVYTLKNDKLNKYSALFICTILNKEDYKYSYGRARILGKIVDEIIKLPADKNGEPDREFMENYIKNLPYGDRI